MAYDSNSASYLNVYGQRGSGMLLCFSETTQHQPSNSAWPELQQAAGTPGAAYCLNTTATQLSSTSAGQGYGKLQMLTASSAKSQQAQQGFGAGLISTWPAGTVSGSQPGSLLAPSSPFAPSVAAPAAPTALQQQLEQVMMQFEQPASQRQLASAVTPPSAAAAGQQACTDFLPPANSYSQLQLQLQLQSNAATDAGVAPEQQQQRSDASKPQQQQQQQQQQQPCVQLGELQLLLPAVHAEYKSEMALMLRACQVATCATKHSAATGSTLVLDPASRNQLQRQVLANCNDKHAAVTAAFKRAAQAIAAAAAAIGSSTTNGSIQVEPQPQPQQQQTPAAAVAGQQSRLATQGSSAAAAAAATGPGSSYDPASAAAADAMAYTWQCLDRLRSTYQQELVAATSALFAICRGFGQCYALSPAATDSIKAALAAAQQQHARVEQLWSDLVIAAGADQI